MAHIVVIHQDSADAPYEVSRDGLSVQGPTLGSALDRLLAQMDDTDEPLLLVRQDRPDRFFGQREFDRLQALRERVKGEGAPLNDAEQEELRQLIAQEFRATIARTDVLPQRDAA